MLYREYLACQTGPKCRDATLDILAKADALELYHLYRVAEYENLQRIEACKLRHWHLYLAISSLIIRCLAFLETTTQLVM